MSIVSKLLAQLTGNAEMSSHFTDYMGIVSVKTHGTMGDNVTNDTVAIEAAKAAAIAAGNLALYFPEGQYLVDPDLDLVGYFLWGDNASFNDISDVINQVGNWMNATAESITTVLLKDKSVISSKLADDVQIGSLALLNAIITGSDRLNVIAALNSTINMILSAILTSQAGAYTYAATATGNDTYVVTLSPVPNTYSTGMFINVKVDVGNTGSASVNANAKGAKTIKKYTGAGIADIATGDMVAGNIYTLAYDGTYMLLMNPTGMNNLTIGDAGKSVVSQGSSAAFEYPNPTLVSASNDILLSALTERAVSSTGGAGGTYRLTDSSGTNLYTSDSNGYTETYTTASIDVIVADKITTPRICVYAKATLADSYVLIKQFNLSCIGTYRVVLDYKRPSGGSPWSIYIKNVYVKGIKVVNSDVVITD